MKTIFIIVSQALLIRNILRSGTLELLKKDGHHICIFIACDEIPLYIKDEFSDVNIILIPYSDKGSRAGRFHKKFILFTHFLINNNSTKVYFSYSRHYIRRSRVSIFIYQLFLRIFGTLQFLKGLVRWIEAVHFPERKKKVFTYFDVYKPDLVFSTSITSVLDVIFMKEAKRRNIKTVSMTKSWDNATKMFYRFIPDYFLAQNELVKDKLITLQRFPEEKIHVVGFPQFDWYRRKEIFKTKEEHLQSKGLDPSRRVIFFGSQGSWFPYDYQIAEKMYEWIQNDELVKPCQLIVRPHFSNVKKTPLKHMKGLPRVAYDDSYQVSDVFNDNWDPTDEEIIDFANTLLYSDVVVIVLSTIALDAVCFDKPIINALFNGTYRGTEDVTSKLSKVVHYQWVLDTHATTVVASFDALKAAINTYLISPDTHKDERALLLNKACYRVDGKSSERIAKAINDVLCI